MKIIITILLAAFSIVIALMIGLNLVSQRIQPLGANNPDRCSLFTQTASRSLKDVAKASSAKVFLVRATNNGASARFFQLFDRAIIPVGANSPVYSAPIPGTTASYSPGVLVEVFDPPIRLASGAAFALSSTFGNYSSSAGVVDRNNLTVTICYE